MFNLSVALFFINHLQKKVYFFRFVKVSLYISDSDNIVSIANCTKCKYDTA